jgi:hypothetical protein
MKKKKVKKIEKTGIVLANFNQDKPRKIGRPPKTLRNLPKGWQDHILDEMAQGASLEEIKADFSISDAVYYRFMKEYDVFAEFIARGKQLSKAWWLKTGRQQMFNKEFSFTGWYMNMKNRFGWTDRQEVDHNINVPTRITIHKEDKIIELLPPAKETSGGQDDYS